MNRIALLAALSAVATLILVARRRGRSAHGEPDEDIGRPAEGTMVAAPDHVEVGGEIPDRPAPKEWHDMSKRRRLPVTEYRTAPDERETEPNEATR